MGYIIVVLILLTTFYFAVKYKGDYKVEIISALWVIAINASIIALVYFS